jgi:hypothetical protein
MRKQLFHIVMVLVTSSLLLGLGIAHTQNSSTLTANITGDLSPASILYQEPYLDKPSLLINTSLNEYFEEVYPSYSSSDLASEEPQNAIEVSEEDFLSFENTDTLEGFIEEVYQTITNSPIEDYSLIDASTQAILLELLPQSAISETSVTKEALHTSAESSVPEESLSDAHFQYLLENGLEYIESDLLVSEYLDYLLLPGEEILYRTDRQEILNWAAFYKLLADHLQADVSGYYVTCESLNGCGELDLWYYPYQSWFRDRYPQYPHFNPVDYANADIVQNLYGGLPPNTELMDSFDSNLSFLEALELLEKSIPLPPLEPIDASAQSIIDWMNTNLQNWLDFAINPTPDTVFQEQVRNNLELNEVIQYMMLGLNVYEVDPQEATSPSLIDELLNIPVEDMVQALIQWLTIFSDPELLESFWELVLNMSEQYEAKLPFYPEIFCTTDGEGQLFDNNPACIGIEPEDPFFPPSI